MFLTLGILSSSGATISTFSPDRGGPGTQVTIQGTGLATATAVFFGALNAPGEIISRSATAVIARVPPNALTGQIAIQTSNSGTASSLGIFVAAPRIEEINPAAGPPGTMVVISGVNFAAPGTARGRITEVLFNNAPAVFEISAQNQLVAVVPTNATTGPISISNEAGTFTTPVPFVIPAVITGFEPASGRPGDVVSIRGRSFDLTLEVLFGQARADFDVESGTNILAVVPTNAINSAIQVVTPAGPAVSSSNFVVLPRIISFSPTSGDVGTNVVLEGGGFHGVTRVEFGGRQATFTAQSSTRVTAVVPPNVTTGPITIVTTNGTFTTETHFSLPARVNSFNPPSGKRGDTVVISGLNLSGATAVRFNGVPADTFQVVSDTQVSAVVPPLATSGQISVVTGAGEATSAATFNVLPVLDGFNPTTVSRGAPVNLLGAGLTNLAWVRIGGVDATFTVINSTNARAIVPLNAFSGPVRVRAVSGVEAEAPGNLFVEGAQPSITSFAPDTGGPGTQVTITGQGLATAAQVQFNGVNATFTVVSGTEVRATVPAGATTGPIAVTTLDGIAVSSGNFVVPIGETRLTIARQGNQIVITWPAAAATATLQASPGLGAGANWQPVPQTPETIGDTRRVTIPVPETGVRFFRLAL